MTMTTTTTPRQSTLKLTVLKVVSNMISHIIVYIYPSTHTHTHTSDHLYILMQPVVVTQQTKWPEFEQNSVRKSAKMFASSIRVRHFGRKSKFIVETGEILALYVVPVNQRRWKLIETNPCAWCSFNSSPTFRTKSEVLNKLRITFFIHNAYKSKTSSIETILFSSLEIF